MVSREVGVSVATLERWRAQSLADGAGSAGERELHCKDKALAEMAALLVLAGKLSAVFPAGEDA